MKFGPMEGTPKEIKNFFQNNGLNAADYFTPPEAPIRSFWFLLSGSIVLFAFAILTLCRPQNMAVVTFVFLMGCAAAVWLAAIIQIRFKSGWATTVVVIGCLLILLVALGVITPQQMLDHAKSLKK